MWNSFLFIKLEKQSKGKSEPYSGDGSQLRCGGVAPLPPALLPPLLCPVLPRAPSRAQEFCAAHSSSKGTFHCASCCYHKWLGFLCFHLQFCILLQKSSSVSLALSDERQGSFWNQAHSHTRLTVMQWPCVLLFRKHVLLSPILQVMGSGFSIT